MKGALTSAGGRPWRTLATRAGRASRSTPCRTTALWPATARSGSSSLEPAEPGRRARSLRRRRRSARDRSRRHQGPSGRYERLTLSSGDGVPTAAPRPARPKNHRLPGLVRPPRRRPACARHVAASLRGIHRLVAVSLHEDPPRRRGSSWLVRARLLGGQERARPHWPAGAARRVEGGTVVASSRAGTSTRPSSRRFSARPLAVRAPVLPGGRPVRRLKLPVK